MEYPDRCDVCLNTGHVETVFPYLAGREGRDWVRAIYRCERHCITWWSYWTIKTSIPA